MARKSNWLERLEDKSLLQLDAGDLLFSTDHMPELLKDQARLQARHLLKTMDALRHDAVVPGEKDFALGLKEFEKLRKQFKIKFVAANLVARKGGARFEKSVVFKRNTGDGKAIRIAVVGIVGDQIAYPSELKVLPTIATARKAVEAVRAKADIVVVLSHCGLDQDRELAAQVPGIDIIVGGHSQSFLQEPQKVGKTLIVQSSFRNQYIGALPLAVPFSGADYKLVGLDAGYESPEGKPSAMDQAVARFKKELGELNAKSDAKLEKLASAEAVSTGAKFHTFPKCAECHLKQFDFWRKTRHSLALGALIDKQQFKNKECLGCHSVGLGDPKGFANVNALAEFKREPELPVDEPSPEPLATEELATFLKTLHDAPDLGAKVRITAVLPEAPLKRSLNSLHRAWVPVQCENCHQAGRDHPFSGAYSKKVENSACLKCHTAERAPGWYTASGKLDTAKFEAKRALVACPAGNLEASATEE